MQLRLETDEASSLMTVVTSYVIDHGGVSQDAKQRIRRWRTDHEQGKPAMVELADGINGALGAYVEEKSDRVVRRKGRYVRAKERS
ncbi:MAG: hypothetical protein WD904_09015 [Dehalococcoidia bacterium]